MTEEPLARRVSGTPVFVLLALMCGNPLLLLLAGSPPWTLVVVPLTFFAALYAVERRHGWNIATAYVVNAVLLFGTFLHFEVAFRTRFADFVMENLYQIYGAYYHNRPHLQSRLVDKEYSVDYLTSGDGYRIGYSHHVDVSIREVDWLFLGDSYTQGAQVQFEELFTSHIARRFPSKIVLNAGVSGWGIYESLEFLRARGANLKPQIVFLQISNFNDFMNVRRRHADLTDYLMQESSFVRVLLQRLKYRNPDSLPLGRWVEPFYATERENRRYNVFYRLTSREKEADLDEFAVALRRLAEFTRSLNAELVLVQVPTKEQVSFRFLEEAVSGLGLDPRLLDLERPNRIVARLADSLGLRVIDPLDQWRSAEDFPFFEYDEHLSVVGHKMLAEAIVENLNRRLPPTTSSILSTSYGGDRYPQFTVNSDSIVFHSPRNGNSELVQADIATWTEVQLTIDDVNETHPVILPGGHGLAFVVGDAENGSTKVWLSDRLARMPVPISVEGEFGSVPAVFPDGSRLVVPTWGPNPGADDVRLTVVHLSSGTREALPQAGSNVWRPAVHPSGQHIVYIAQIEGQYDLFELDLGSRVTTRLTETPWDEWDPAYSPSGESVVYAARKDGNWDLFVLSREDRSLRQLTTTRGDEWDPQYSSDGKHIVFAGEFGLFRGIYLMLAPH